MKFLAPVSWRRRQPSSMPPPQVGHGVGAHREAEFDQHLVDLLRQGAFDQEPLRLHAARAQHAVADEAVADADQHRDLVDLARHGHRGRDHPSAVLAARTISKSRMTLAGEKKCRPITDLRPRRHGRDLVDVQRRGVGGRGSRLSWRTCRASEKSPSSGSMFSYTASMMRSASRHPSSLRLGVISAMRLSMSAGVRPPRAAVFS